MHIRYKKIPFLVPKVGMFYEYMGTDRVRLSQVLRKSIYMEGHQLQDNMGKCQHPTPQCSLGLGLGKATNTIKFLGTIIFIILISSVITEFLAPTISAMAKLETCTLRPLLLPWQKFSKQAVTFRWQQETDVYYDSDCLFASEALSTSQSQKRFFEKHLLPLKKGLEI